MGIINRITTTISASVDKAVNQVENHDAIIDAAIKDCKTSLVKARVRYSRVKKDGDKLRQKLDELIEMEETWTQRAKKSGHENEQLALDCLQRKNQCHERIKKTRQSLSQHAELEDKVSKSIETIEQRLAKTIQQRNMMRSRHSTADALRVINSIEGATSNGDIDDTFERWEMTISEAEFEVMNTEPVDSLDKSFEQSENESELRIQLAELMEEQEGNKNE